MINKIPFKFTSKLFIYKISASFDGKFYQLSMNKKIESAKFEAEPTFENTINKTKDNNLKNITYIVMILSAIPLKKTPHHLNI